MSKSLTILTPFVGFKSIHDRVYETCEGSMSKHLTLRAWPSTR